MPQLRVKIKEVPMSLKKELLELETTANQISRMVNAVELMAMGLDMRDDPYANGFFAVCGYLVQTGQTLRQQVENCLHAL